MGFASGIYIFRAVSVVALLLGRSQTQHKHRQRRQDHYDEVICKRPSVTSTIPIAIRPPGCNRRSNLVLFSQLYQKQIDQDIQSRYLEPLIIEANLDLDKLEFEPFSDLGFCNNVYRVEQHNNNNKQGTCLGHNKTLVAKIFSDLAKKRLDPSRRFGEMDELLDDVGLGPRVLAHTSDALLMEYIDGKVLTESMLFDKDNGLRICESVGDTLGKMHNLPGHFGPNMLWHALEVMLSAIDKDIKIQTDAGTTWNLPMLQDTIEDFRNRIEALQLPCVPVGHGDFKTSNVMIQSAKCDIKFIDFELSGTHYRGYDLAKFFRSANLQSSPNGKRAEHQEAFWEGYHKRTAGISCKHRHTVPSSKQTIADAVSQLKWEAQLLEPMTWLEAATFFLCMATLDSPSKKEKWTGLAQSRLGSYEKTAIHVK